MSKFRCRCGHIISITTDMLPYDLWLVKNADLENIAKDMEQKTTKVLTYDSIKVGDEYDYKMIEANKSTMFCEMCGRLWISPIYNVNIYYSFLWEDQDKFPDEKNILGFPPSEDKMDWLAENATQEADNK